MTLVGHVTALGLLTDSLFFKNTQNARYLVVISGEVNDQNVEENIIFEWTYILWRKNSGKATKLPFENGRYLTHLKLHVGCHCV